MTTLLYTKPGCPYCRDAREDLTRRGEAFEERDVTVEPAWRSELMRHTSGAGMVPVLVRAQDDSLIQVGFPPGRG